MLVVVIVVLLFLGLLLFLNYLPVIWQYYVLRRSEQNVVQQLELLNKAHSNYLVVVTQKLGLGPSQNSDIKFVQAHQNQHIAMSSIIGLIDEMYRSTEE